MILDDDTGKWARATMVVGILTLVGALFMIGATIYGATQKTQTSAEAAMAAIQILCVAISGALALLAWRKRSKLFVGANLAFVALLTLLVLVGLIITVAGPTAEYTEQQIDATCQLKNLQESQCDIVKRFTLAGVYVIQVLTLCYCFCYLGVAALFFRAFRRAAHAVPSASSLDDDGAAPNADGFDDFPSAEKVPMLNVSANVI